MYILSVAGLVGVYISISISIHHTVLFYVIISQVEMVGVYMSCHSFPCIHITGDHVLTRWLVFKYLSYSSFPCMYIPGIAWVITPWWMFINLPYGSLLCVYIPGSVGSIIYWDSH